MESHSTTPPQRTELMPRAVLAKHFPRDCAELPIRGGWGFTKEDAVVIDKNDPIVNPAMPFDGVGIEYLFVEKRIYEELIINLPAGEKFSGITWDLITQGVVADGDRKFDHLEFEIRAFRDQDWEDLKAEWEGPNGCTSPNFDEEAHTKKRDSLQVCLRREYWFDITSFFFEVSAASP